MTSEHPIEPPTRVGRYEIVKALGAGSYALVFAAYDPELERHVALKVFLAPYATGEIESEARALKPDNILLGRNGRVLIADLGRARTLDAVDGSDGGAVTYMAPERIEGASSSPVADQFGLCTVLWQALYAVRPWSMNSAEVVRSTRPKRARLRTDVPRSLLRVIRRGLVVMSRDRFENMDALTRVLVDARRR